MRALFVMILSTMVQSTDRLLNGEFRKIEELKVEKVIVFHFIKNNLFEKTSINPLAKESAVPAELPSLFQNLYTVAPS